MVHALEEIHRLLRPDGYLIDIHPVLEAPVIEVYHGAKLLFAEPGPDYWGEDYRQADHALTQVTQRHLFVVERSGEFDFLTHSSSVAELRDFLAEANAYEARPKEEAAVGWNADLTARVEAVMQAAGQGAEVAYHERARIARLKPVR